ncbi:MAG: ATP-binding cassette domain-containing protein [Sphingomonas fennica]
MTAIALDGIVKRYGGAVALDGVSIAIPAGQFVALVGLSGSGKSTLLKTINALVRPDAGRVTVAGQDAADPVRLRRAIGYVFQHVGLMPHMNVAENVALGPRIAGAPPPDVAALLDLVGLSADHAARMPAALSGGQAQRVGVARALATSPKVLLMDEPFGALDPVTRDRLGQAVRDLHDRLGLTTVMVTHDMAEALLLADRIVVMAAGRIVGDAAPADIIADRGGEAAAALVAVPQRQMARLRELGA